MKIVQKYNENEKNEMKWKLIVLQDETGEVTELGTWAPVHPLLGAQVGNCLAILSAQDALDATIWVHAHLWTEVVTYINIVHGALPSFCIWRC